MNTYSYISFDLQGTLSDSRFSDEFWMITLPQIYAESRRVSLKQAKLELSSFFKTIGPYDYRYYDWRYWRDWLKPDLTFESITAMLSRRPKINASLLELIQTLWKNDSKLLILSSTTRDFIEEELGDNIQYFSHVFSSWDDFCVAGKTSDWYRAVCRKLGVTPQSVIHIGDSKEMDVDNATKAGMRTYYFDKKIPERTHLLRITDLFHDSL